MNRRKNLVALGRSDGAQDGDLPQEETGAEDMAMADADEEYTLSQVADAWDDELQSPSRGWVLPTLALLAIAGWTGFFGWANQREILAGGTPAQWSAWIVAWAVPVLLVVAVWILAMRNSTREAVRFGQTARLLSAESRALEDRLLSVNRELSLAREFIASQSRDLESLGRVASERLSTHADRLQGLIRDNGEQVNAIGQVSDTALANMDKLRDRLPVIANAARDVTSQIGHAGNTAQDRLEEMVGAFQRLNEFGEASGRQADALRDKVSEALATFDARLADIDRQAQDRFEALRIRDEEFRQDLEARETDTLASLRRRAEELAGELAAIAATTTAGEEEAIGLLNQRLDTLRQAQDDNRQRWATAIDEMQARITDAITRVSQVDEAAITNARKRMDSLSEAGTRVDASIMASVAAFDAEFSRRREALASEQAEALAALEARMGDFDNKATERREGQLEHLAALAQRGETLAGRIALLDQEIARIAAMGRTESATLGESAEQLAERVSQARAILEESGTFVSRLTDDSVRLLEIIRASAAHSEGDLSRSIEVAENRLANFENRAIALNATVAEAEAKGTALAEHIARTGEQSAASLETIEALQARVDALASQVQDLAETSGNDLQQAIEQLETASLATVEQLRSGQAEAVREIAAQVGSEGRSAISEALQAGAREAIAALEESTRAASENGRAAAGLLRDQLAKVNELAGNLEQRVAQARAQAEEQVNNDYTRRMALITESLNSCSIDIARAFDAEVADTAWASYLKGDRGIFTRRAVRLLENSEIRAISEAYENDSELRQGVNRYIHDFEAMLRTVLSTRDGNAMAVTLLSSDIGKLYVVLAQAIERLRD